MSDILSDMKTINVRELLRNHDQIVSMVQAGESVVITRRQKPIYSMNPVEPPRGKRPDITARLKEIYGDEVISREKMAEVHRRNKGRC